MGSPLRPLGRVFSGDKVIDNTLLNLLGAQVARTVAARMIYSLRSVKVDPSVAAQVAEFQREGVVVLPGFLPPDRFEGVRQEFARLASHQDTAKIVTAGPNRLEGLRIRDFGRDRLPFIHGFCDDARLRAIARAAERRPVGDLSSCTERECLTQGAGTDQEDPQTILHSDIFFNTFKAWFYLEDVGIEDGPLVFVKGSHRLNPTSLFFTYQHSCRRDRSSDPSRRITARERDRLGLEESILTCAKNTLVIVNTCGYHRRLQGQPGRTRHALHLFLRADPFMAYGLRARLARHGRVAGALRRARARLRRTGIAR
jgi:hypothetical protein